MAFTADEIRACKAYMRAEEEDDSVVEGFMAAAAESLRVAVPGTQDRPDDPLYRLALHSLTLYYYDHRDAVGSETALPVGLGPILTQLKARGLADVGRSVEHRGHPLCGGGPFCVFFEEVADMQMDAGKLRHRICFERFTGLQDELGDPQYRQDDAWEPVATVWAAIDPVSGREFYEAQQSQSEVTHKIRIRYRAGLETEMRIVYGTRRWAIVSILDWEERHESMLLLCRELVR